VAKKSGKSEPQARRLSEFKAEKNRDPLPVYVLRGTDPYLMDQGRQEVRARVIGDADPGLAMLETVGAETRLAEVFDALRTLPFLAPRRLVLVREADPFVKDCRETLEKYLAEPSPCGTLCLEVATWNEQTRLAKRVAEIGALVACEIADAANLPAWLQDRAKKGHGKKLAPAAARMLTEYLGHDFASLLGAVEMLALYVGARPDIGETDVDALVTRGHHERVWDLCDAVAEGRVVRALELLDAFIAEGMVTPQIVGLLRSTFRQLVRVQALTQRRGFDAAMQESGVPWPARDRVRRALAALSADDLADAYQALVDADAASKSSSADERLILDALVHRLCTVGAARRAVVG
jgi:DNA polymerase-3 subunit delta